MRVRSSLLRTLLMALMRTPRAALGSTVPLPFDALKDEQKPSYSPLAKTRFSMVLPEVVDSLKTWGTRSVVIVGIEVRKPRRDTSSHC